MTKKDYIKFVGVWKKSIRFMGDARERGYHYIDADSLYSAMCDIFEEDNYCIELDDNSIVDLPWINGNDDISIHEMKELIKTSALLQKEYQS